LPGFETFAAGPGGGSAVEEHLISYHNPNTMGHQHHADRSICQISNGTWQFQAA
jgi:hypothetical protein